VFTLARAVHYSLGDCGKAQSPRRVLFLRRCVAISTAVTQHSQSLLDPREAVWTFCETIV